MHRLRPFEEHRAVAELVTDVHGVVRYVNDSGKPVALTAEGRDIAVLMSIEAFEQMQTAAANPALQSAVERAESGIAAGRWIEHADIEAKLRRWAGDEP